jgi:hypothetical protein
MKMLLLYVGKMFMSLAQRAPGSVPDAAFVTGGASYPMPSRRANRR